MQKIEKFNEFKKISSNIEGSIRGSIENSAVSLFKNNGKKNRFAWKKNSKFDYYTEIWLQKSQKNIFIVSI
jgi:hypothetical protein